MNSTFLVPPAGMLKPPVGSYASAPWLSPSRSPAPASPSSSKTEVLAASGGAAAAAVLTRRSPCTSKSRSSCAWPAGVPYADWLPAPAGRRRRQAEPLAKSPTASRASPETADAAASAAAPLHAAEAALPAPPPAPGE
jgi:hypothetical protein